MDAHATNFKSKIELSNIDELNDISAKRKTEIFKRAAEISPNVLECTIGPKVTLCSEKLQNVDKENIQNLSLTPDKLTDQSKIKTSPQIRPQNENTRLQSSPLFDLHMIRNALALKSSEKERKERLRKEVEGHRLELELKIKQNIICHREPNEIQSNSLINLRTQNDLKIFEEAERYAIQEQEKNINQLKKINHEKNRKLREISLKAIPTGKFTHNYEKLVQLLISQDKNSISDEYNKQLKELVLSFEALIQKLKSLQIGPAEVLMAESLCDKVVALQNKLQDDLKAKQAEQKNIELQKRVAEQQRAKEQQQQNLQQHLQQQQLLQQQQQEQNRKAQEMIQQKQLVDTVDNSNTNKSYGSLIKYFAEVCERVKSFELDENTKKFRVACKRLLNIQVTTISASSPQHLRDKFERIFNFINGQNVKQTAADINVNDYPLGKEFSLLLLVRLLVMQAKAEISSNVQVAFPIASVIISIWNIIPDFGKIFLGLIFFESPFLVPYFHQNQKGISDITYLITLGYKVDENGAVEDNDSYFKRQTGIIRLYFAIMISSGCRSQRQKHPYSIENGWKFLCNILSLNPISDICATVIYEFLQLSGNEMYARYGRQFHKLLCYMQQCYMPKLSQIDDRRPRKERLETYLQQILQKGSIEKPKGILDVEFW